MNILIITPDWIPMGKTAAVELDKIQKKFGGERGYGGEVNGQWLKIKGSNKEINLKKKLIHIELTNAEK